MGILQTINSFKGQKCNYECINFWENFSYVVLMTASTVYGVM